MRIKSMLASFLAAIMLVTPVISSGTELVLPESYDSRTDHPLGCVVTEIKDQGPYGTCWAHAMASALETSMIINGIAQADSVDLSELHLVYFRYNHLADPLGGTEGDYKETTSHSELFSGAGTPGDAVYPLRAWAGPVAEERYPYSDAYQITGILANTPEHAYGSREAILTESAYVPFEVDAMKEAIMQYGSLVTSYYSTWSSVFENPENAARYCNQYRGVNHAITIIGWDDHYPKDGYGSAVAPDDGAWLVKNSWGTDTVGGGCFWLSYYDLSLAQCFYVNVCAPDKYDNNYQYDGFKGSNEIVSAAGRIDGANVFTVHANEGYQEALTAVQFDTFYRETNYSIQIYKDLTDRNDPTSGTAVLDTPLTGENLLNGFYTVDLPEAITLNQGETFSVVVTLSRSNSENDAAFELENNILSSKAGQSFISTDGGVTWGDICASAQRGNLRIKAFTKNTEEPTVTVDPTEPETTEPEVTEPEATEPEVTEPEVTEPEATEPEVTEPEATEPEVTEPEVTEPEATEPEVTEPEATEPEATEPEVTEPEVTEPEVTEPEVTEPEVTEPEVTEPETTEPEATKPQVPEDKPDVTDVFTDVYDEWYVEYIQYVYDNNLMIGIGGAPQFLPNDNITKAQVAQILYNMEGRPGVRDKKVFDELKDVYDTQWYADAVAWAYNTGVIKGDLYTKEFSPNADITREQLALMIFRYAKFKGYRTYQTSSFTGLANADKVSDWAVDGVKWAVGAGLIIGVDRDSVKDLAPQGHAARAQVAAILQRFCETVIQ